MNFIKSINLFGNELKSSYSLNIDSDTALSFSVDSRISIDTQNITLTLNFENNEDNVKVEIYAFKDAIIRYYTDVSTYQDFSIDEGNSISFIYHNGWKYNGIFGAVWN